MAERVDDSGDVGVVADQPGGAGARTGGRALKRDGVDDPEGAGNAADLIQLPDHAGFQRHGDRQSAPALPLPDVLTDPGHEGRERVLCHVNRRVVQLHAKTGIGGPVQCRGLRMADRVPEHGGPQRHTQRPGLSLHQALYLATYVLCSASVLANRVSLVSRLMVTQ